jgi:hypothetical protein
VIVSSPEYVFSNEFQYYDTLVRRLRGNA